MRPSEEVLRQWIIEIDNGRTIAAIARSVRRPRKTISNWVIKARRRLAATGHASGPPLPPAAMPPPGMRISTNSGEYDASGNLVRQWVGSTKDSGAEFVPPKGHLVKGVSALVDADGRELVKWIKTREGSAGEGLVEALREEFSAFRGAAQQVPSPGLVEEDLMVVYPLPDLHIGAYAWGRETGGPYDTEIAVSRALEAARTLVGQAPRARRGVLLGLGDYFHTNDQTNATPASRHRLDVDGRWPKVYRAGARLAASLVSLLLAHHEEVEVVFLPGNHDPDAAVCLTVALDMLYDGHNRVRVHSQPGLFWFMRHGACLLGATHGHTMKPDRMAMVLATDRSRDWGETTHRHFFFGHVHHESVKEVGPVRVESFNTPASRDAWAHGGGYRSGQSMCSIVFDRNRGEVMRQRVNIAPHDAS